MSPVEVDAHTAKHRPLAVVCLQALLARSSSSVSSPLDRCHSSTPLSFSLSLFHTPTHTQPLAPSPSLCLSLSGGTGSHLPFSSRHGPYPQASRRGGHGRATFFQAAPDHTPEPSRYHFIVSGDKKVVRVGLDSFLITDFLTSAEATLYFTRLQAELVSRYVPRSDPALQFKIFDKVNQLPRDKAFLGDVENGTSPQYRYNPPGNDQYPDVQQWTPATKELRDKLCQLYNQYTNHLVANRYVNGQDHIGLHHDKDRDFHQGSSVLTVSFGQERRFELRLVKQPNDDATHEAKIQLVLPHGSVFVLGPITNKLYTHSIVKETSKTKTVGTRISLTYRSIARIINKQPNEVVTPMAH